MAVPWVRFTENALVPKIMLQFQNGDTFQHQGDSAGIFMYSAGIFETFVKKILCPRASPMCSAVLTFTNLTVEEAAPYYRRRELVTGLSCMGRIN